MCIHSRKYSCHVNLAAGLCYSTCRSASFPAWRVSLSFHDASVAHRCAGNGVVAGNSRLAAESGRREAEFTFEGAVKGRLRLIADLSSDLRNAAARGFEHLRAELKPPACEVGNGGLREITPETLGQHGTRNSDLVASDGNRPRMGRLRCSRAKAFPTSGSRTPASHPVCSGGSSAM